ncbi:MAG: hypothetical protein Q8L48_13005 [Archangium sp.]|nr:hypothetical protein [Archangium sp.]
MSAKDLETSLRSGGEKVSEGRIRIDSARALQRLRDFRFAEPSHWVLEVLRAAALSGAKTVAVRTDADDVEVVFDGEPFPPELMKHLLEQALNAGKTPDEKRTRLLALGAAGALGVGARFVKVHSGGLTLSLEGDEVELVEEKGRGTQFHLRKAFGWRVTSAFFRGSPEARAVTERAHHFPGKLTLNGKSLPTQAPRQSATRVLQGEGWRMELFLPPGPPLRGSELELDVAGVVVASRGMKLPGLQLNGWLRADGLRRNASGSDVVDDDQTLQSALVALRKASRELLGSLGKDLAEDDLWRRAFIAQLLDEETLDDQAKKVLHQLPLIAGPAGELASLDELAGAAREHARVYVAKRPWPKGSYPAPTVLLSGDLSFTKLLPPGKRIDVEELVKQKEQVAINRQRHEQMESESPTLPSRAWVATAKIEATAVTGEVGFEAGGNGAFVRVLHKGRLMEAGELTALAPLRLRAVVDWGRPLGDTFFTENGASKLLGLVLKYVEVAATKAVCDALPKPEALPHALDLLTRLVTLRDSAQGELPEALLAAPLFPCLDGTHVALQVLQGEARWRFVNFRVPQGLLDGGRVLVLSPALRDVLKRLGPKRLEDVTTQLRDEEDVRRRLAGPRRPANVVGVVAKVQVEGEGLSGEVGVPRSAGTRLELSLLKAGLLLETTELSARYHCAVASVDCEALSPNARWTAVTRDGAFKAVSAAVHDAQRRLAVALAAVPPGEWTPGAELFLVAFLKKELTPLDPSKLDDVTRAVANAPLFDCAQGRRSLLQLKEWVTRERHFYVIGEPRPLPDGFEVLVARPALAAALGEVLGLAPEDPTGVLVALDARRRLSALPEAEFKLPSGLALECRLTEARFTVLAGLRDGLGDQATGHVHVDGRVYAVLMVPCALPLAVLIDAPGLEPNAARELTGPQREEVGKLVERAMQAVLRRALERGDEDSRRASLLALGRGLDRALPEKDAAALRARELFPCTDGLARSLEDLDPDAPQFVSTSMEGELPNRRPIIVANDALLRLALRRWPRAEDVGSQLAMQLAALRRRETLSAYAEVVSNAGSPWRQRFSERGLSGEVVVTGTGAGRLELFIDKKPVCVVEGALPAPLAGAIDSPRFTPTPGFTGVVEDEHFKEAVEVMKVAGERLAAQLVVAPRRPDLEPVLVQLAFWVAASMAWHWKGKKRAKGKKKNEGLPAAHALLAEPLLRATDGSALPVQRLVSLHRNEGAVEVAKQGGRFLEPGRKAWWPRPDEERWAAPLGLTLRDVTAELQLADSIRQRPRFEEVRSPLAGTWREPVHGPSLLGEVALGEAPDGKLVIEVLHERMLLETWSSDHPVGGVARVDSAALTPDEKWTSAKRDASFKALVSATEAAVERLLVRRLVLPDERGFRAWAGVAVRWRSGQAGPLAALVPALELFTDLSGRPLSVGAVLDLATRKGKVPVSRALGGVLVSAPELRHAPERRIQGTQRSGEPAAEATRETVLLDSSETRSMLSTLGLQFDDVSGELKRARDLQQALTARRLASLTWKGECLVKVPVSTGPLTGELALATDSRQAGVMLARDGISIAPLEDSWPGVVGVIDVKDLSVNDDWTVAQPTRVQRSLIRAQVERLFVALAEAAPGFSDREREVAAHWALRFLCDSGVETGAHLDRLTGAAHEVADAPLFLTVEGERVNLRSVAAEVSSRERVAVLARSAGVPEGAVTCVLATSSFDAPWLSALEDVLGKPKIWRVTELEAWRSAVREADPQEGTPELQGLRFLRREVRLLRAGALGHLTPDDLEDVKLSRAGGKTPLRYDRKRKLALLDPEHPDIARTLKEAQQRPERVWVLIAALFGLVNRELDHVTDAHEAQLVMALAGHLASNPKLLA